MTYSTTTSMLMTPESSSLDATFFLNSQHFLHPPHIQLFNGLFLSGSTKANRILHLPLKTCCLLIIFPKTWNQNFGINSDASFLYNSHIQDSEALTLCVLESAYLSQWIGIVSLTFAQYMIVIAMFGSHIMFQKFFLISTSACSVMCRNPN